MKKISINQNKSTKNEVILLKQNNLTKIKRKSIINIGDGNVKKRNVFIKNKRIL